VIFLVSGTLLVSVIGFILLGSIGFIDIYIYPPFFLTLFFISKIILNYPFKLLKFL
jgi:hypothetical protein